MKILYLITDISTSGGVERVSSLKMNYFVEKFNYNIDILVRNKRNEDFHFFLDPKINVYNLNFDSNKNFFQRQIFKIKKCFYLVKLLKKNKYDIIITTGFILDPFLLFFKKYTKIIKEIHGAKEALYPIKYRFPKKYLLSFHKIILLTKNDLYDWNLNNSIVIPNPLPFYPEEYSKCENKKIISVGRLVKDKGYDILIDVWNIIAQKYPNWVLEVYGDGPEREKLQDKIKRLELEKSFLLRGTARDIKEKYLEGSIYVMSSRTEGFGMVLIEAMVCGLPVVSFDCSFGPKNIIKNNGDGFLVKFGNIKQMAEKIEELIVDEKKRKLFGNNARKNVQRFSQEKIMTQWKNLFEELVGSK